MNYLGLTDTARKWAHEILCHFYVTKIHILCACIMLLPKLFELYSLKVLTGIRAVDIALKCLDYRGYAVSAVTKTHAREE